MNPVPERAQPKPLFSGTDEAARVALPGSSSWPRGLAPGSLAGRPAGRLLAVVCLAVLIGLSLIDLTTPPNITVSAVGVFPILAAAWFLSLRTTAGIVALAVFLQVYEVAVSSIEWLSMVADIPTFLLMAAIGRFAASNWAAMNAGLEREWLLLREQERARERLEAVLDVAQSILEGRPVEEFTHLVALRARSLSGADVAAVAIPDSTYRTWTFQMVEGDAADGLLGLQVRAEDSGLGALLATDSPVILDNLSQANGPDSTALTGTGAAMLLPLAAGSRRFGTLMLANLAGARQFTEQDRTLIELFAAQVAVALEYARIRDELRRLVLIEDRERISRELHDGVIQSLFAIGIELESAVAVDPAQSAAVQRTIREINGVIRDLRGYIYGLVPGLLYDRDLEAALTRLAEDFRTRLKLVVTTRINSAVAQLLAARSLDIIQFTTEALSNAARHSGSSTCTVTMDRSGDHAVLEIRDEGGGFDPAAVTGKGLGLSSLRERAARLGGEMKIESAVGVGTAVRLIIPLVETKAD